MARGGHSATLKWTATATQGTKGPRG